ncbi:MAG TPA: hypothetical protein VFX61_02640 [Micromonosporaceae bacterium]|nr:hypothetical protein [Micromonosporaceae bacterium]
MRKHDPSDERLPAIGRPPHEPESETPPSPNADFAEEHDATAVTDPIISGENERETESPRGWSGLEQKWVRHRHSS